MKIVVNGEPYLVRIRYDEDKTRIELVNKLDLCVGAGLAICSATDNFCKAIGRKIAFGRALKYYGFNKDERRQAWEQFLAQTRDGRAAKLRLIMEAL